MEREVLRHAASKSATRLYPAEKAPPVKGLHGMVTWQIERCIGCGLCVDVCPSEAIEIVGEQRQAEITYRLDRCIFCNECVDVCPTKTIEATQEYELASVRRKAMVIRFTRDH